MDYEKMYKDALERAKEIKKKIMYSHLSTESCKAVSEYIDAIIPELAESADEKRIRKWLIDYFKEVGKSWIHRDITCEQILAWLEKQKENIEKEYVFRPLAGTDINTAVLQAIRRANEGDRLVLAFNGAYIPVRKGVDANKIVDIYDAFVEKQKEQKPSSKFRSGDWVVYDGPLGHAILQVKDVVGGRYSFVDNVSTLLEEDSDEFLRPLTPKDVEKPAEWSDTNELVFKDICKHLREEGYNGWVVLLEALHSGEFKQTVAEWSEEDEKLIDDVINSLCCYQNTLSDYQKEIVGEEIRKLKSIRPHWKPGEEQMEVLKRASVNEYLSAKQYDILVSLYEQLKKL